jgi:hypothetical protein
MPNQISDDRERLSYLEERHISAELRRIADLTHSTISDMIRESTRRFVISMRGKKTLEISLEHSCEKPNKSH